MSARPENDVGGSQIGRRSVRMLKGFAMLSVVVISLLIVSNLRVSTSSADEVPCDCGFCHGDNHHGDNWTGCSGCHDSPPQTGSHLVHYNSAPLKYLRYGDTTVSSTADAYKFGCGNCHPLDRTNHNNGYVDVELYNPGAPAGSIKAKNPSDAAYAPGPHPTTYDSKVAGGRPLSYSDGTCSNVYCHSGYTISSGPVGLPAGVDEYGNNTYDPYTVNYSRVYKTTPPWGTSGAFSTCAECHDFPLTTSYPAVSAGVGDSHQWIDDYGYGNLHAYNMAWYFAPISCRTCHYGTVTQANTWTRDGNDVTTYDPVPLASRQSHVNGVRDVAFDTTDPVVYERLYPQWTGGGIVATLNLSGAAYDASTKSCSNVACHREQTRVTWGSPYRWWIDPGECDLCHSYSY
jgi:predicted CxxxxCH...CXXCH cytochrome family protein